MGKSLDPVIVEVVFKQLMTDPFNRKCIDCGAADPDMTSVNNGAFLCIKCAKNHFSFGKPVSDVRPVEALWNTSQLRHMILGGNQRLKEQFTKFECEEYSSKRYRSNGISQYQRKLAEKCIIKEAKPDKELSFTEDMKKHAALNAAYLAEQATLQGQRAREATMTGFSSASTATAKAGAATKEALYGSSVKAVETTRETGKSVRESCVNNLSDMGSDISSIANEKARAAKESALYAAEQTKLGLSKAGSKTKESGSHMVTSVKQTGSAVNENVTSNLKDIGSDLGQVASETSKAVGASVSSAFASMSSYFSQKTVDEEVPENID